MSKLEETFNLPKSKDDLKEKSKEIKKGVNQERAKIISVEDLEDHDVKMDEYAKYAFEYAKEIYAVGMDVEARHAAEMFNASANMLKVALDAKNEKLEKRLKLYDLEMKKQKLEHELNKDQGVTHIDGSSVYANREDLLGGDEDED